MQYYFDLIFFKVPDKHFQTFNYYFFRYKRILVIISHSQDFLNGVCTNTIHIEKKSLNYYGVSIYRFSAELVLVSIQGY